ncbi:MAG: 5-formyltetrahydrofolate cyclo-ligase [Oscillospiraceae bacterium]
MTDFMINVNDEATNILTIKNQLRKRHKQIRQNFSFQYKNILDNKIEENLINFILQNFDINKFNNILIYSASSFEVSTKRLYTFFKNNNKAIYYPKCLNTTGDMSFYKIDELNDLTIGFYKILEPTNLNENNKFKNIHSDNLIIIPALAFNENCYRLGYGKGYYDRFLKAFKGLKIIICYDENNDNLILDKFDINADYVVTQSSIYKNSTIVKK